MSDPKQLVEESLTGVDTESSAATQPAVREEKPLTLRQYYERWPRILLWCFALTSAILLYGYDFVIVGNITSMPEFQKVFGMLYNKQYIIPSSWLSLWSVASPIGQMIGAIVGGKFQDRFGRRWSLGLSSLLSAVGVAICYTSYLPEAIDSRRGAFTAGKIFQGLAVGMLLSTTQTYLSEIVPTAMRGPVMAGFPIFTLLGQVIGALVVYGCLKVHGTASFRIPFATQWPLSVLPIIVCALLPESPVWLVRMGRIEEARRAQKRLDIHGDGSVEKIQELTRAESERAKAVSYWACFQGTDRRRTLLVVYANWLPQFFGLKLMVLASYFVEVVGMSASIAVMMLIVGIVLGMFANIASIWLLRAYGRRPLIISTLCISAVLWTGMGISGCFSGTVVMWYTTITLIVIIIVCGLGVWPASFALAAEVSTFRLRALTQGIGWFASGLGVTVFGIALPYMFNTDAGDLRAKVGFVYAALCVLSAIASWWIVPEMKDRTPAEIDALFEAGVPARQFKSAYATQVQGLDNLA
ncbi:general substrate transporter [Xylariales sp. PMI_506]|nr:general substrate transporter [Xylariales sp. PMI_506]